MTVAPGELKLLLQQTETLGGFVPQMYFRAAVSLLAPYGIALNVTDRRLPTIEFTGMVDPANTSDVVDVREKAEKQAPGMNGMLRVIFCRFPSVSQSGEKYFASTEGGRRWAGSAIVQDFILINVGKFRPDGSTLIHEMIHATGLEAHDPDPTSVFAGGNLRTGTILKPEHARRLSDSFFGRHR